MISCYDAARGKIYEIIGVARGNEIQEDDVVLVTWRNNNDEYIDCYESGSPGMAWAFYRYRRGFPWFEYIIGTDKFRHKDYFNPTEEFKEEEHVYLTLENTATPYSDKEIKEYYKDVAESRLQRPGRMPLHYSKQGLSVFVPQNVLDALCMVFNKESYTAYDVVEELCDEVREQTWCMEEYEKDGAERAAKIRAVLNGESKEESNDKA